METELDRRRAARVEEIVDAATNASETEARALIDRILLEWGSEAYYLGRHQMADRIQKCADEWRRATS